MASDLSDAIYAAHYQNPYYFSHYSYHPEQVPFEEETFQAGQTIMQPGQSNFSRQQQESCIFTTAAPSHNYYKYYQQQQQQQQSHHHMLGQFPSQTQPPFGQLHYSQQQQQQQQSHSQQQQQSQYIPSHSNSCNDLLALQHCKKHGFMPISKVTKQQGNAQIHLVPSQLALNDFETILSCAQDIPSSNAPRNSFALSETKNEEMSTLAASRVENNSHALQSPSLKSSNSNNSLATATCNNQENKVKSAKNNSKSNSENASENPTNQLNSTKENSSNNNNSSGQKNKSAQKSNNASSSRNPATITTLTNNNSNNDENTTKGSSFSNNNNTNDNNDNQSSSSIDNNTTNKDDNEKSSNKNASNSSKSQSQLKNANKFCMVSLLNFLTDILPSSKQFHHLIKFIIRVKGSGKMRQKVDIFTLAHFRVLFLTLNDWNVTQLNEADRKMHTLIFPEATSKPSESWTKDELDFMNTIKSQLLQLALSFFEDASNIRLKILSKTWQNQSTASHYMGWVSRITKGIKKMSSGVYIHRF